MTALPHILLSLIAAAWALRLTQIVTARPYAPGATKMQQHRDAAIAMMATHILMVIGLFAGSPVAMQIAGAIMSITYWFGMFIPMSRRIRRAHLELMQVAQ